MVDSDRGDLNTQGNSAIDRAWQQREDSGGLLFADFALMLD